MANSSDPQPQFRRSSDIYIPVGVIISVLTILVGVHQLITPLYTAFQGMSDRLTRIETRLERLDKLEERVDQLEEDNRKLSK
jgi:hypothetical protein